MRERLAVCVCVEVFYFGFVCVQVKSRSEKLCSSWKKFICVWENSCSCGSCSFVRRVPVLIGNVMQGEWMCS